jgi:hypothetical protein
VTRNEALEAARNDSWAVRVEAAEALATLSSREDFVAHTALMQLLLDESNTGVTLSAAEALLGRNDLYAASTVFAGLALAWSSWSDWIINAINAAWNEGRFDAESYSIQIFDGSDPLAKAGAREFSDWSGIGDGQGMTEWYRARRVPVSPE